MADSADNRALYFQELFTAIVRLRANRQEVNDAEVFRGQVKQAIRTAAQNAKAKAYTDEDINLGIFALAAFLDESILNLRKPVFHEWVRKPLQEELFGRHMAGELFFENLQKLLGRRDSEELADLLEVYYLCVLLGYLGKYSIASKGDLRALMGQTEDKIKRIRGNRHGSVTLLDAARGKGAGARRSLAEAARGDYRGRLRRGDARIVRDV